MTVFTSAGFIILFVLLMIVYFVVPKKAQTPILLAFSYGFYFMVSRKLPVYMLITTAVTYLSALLLQRITDGQKTYLDDKKAELTGDEKKEIKRKFEKRRKLVLVIGLVINFSFLAFFKYTDFLLDNACSLLANLGLNVEHQVLNLVLPLGISFYTFQSTGYMIDVYRKKVAAERNLPKLALFVSYFPQIIEGPIGRFDRLASQFDQKHSFSFDRLKKGICLILWGCVKKLIIADNLAPLVNGISENYSQFGGSQILIGMLFYGIQLYADFSGYMDMASGYSKILGIEIAENFRRPYFSTSLAEFWRRWHISLCSWFKDYLFYPVFMSKGLMKLGKKLRAKGHREAAKNVPTFISMAVVWFLTGLWHGACWPEIVWGFSNGLIMIFSLQFAKAYDGVNKALRIKTDSAVWKCFRIVRTYLLVTLLNFICTFATFRDSLSAFAIMIKNPVPAYLSVSYLFPGIIDRGIVTLAVTLLACLALFFVSLYEEKKNVLLYEAIMKKSWIVQGLVFILLLFFVLVFAVGGENGLSGGFMYAQF